MNNLNMTEKVNIMYDYFMHQCNMLENGEEDFQKGTNFDEYYSAKDTSKLMFGFTADMMGYNACPTVVSDSEWDNLNSKVMYHGFARYGYGAEFLSNHVYHYGNGSLMLIGKVNGFYVTDMAGRALTFTDKDLDRDKLDFDRVLPLKLKDNLKTDNVSDLYDDCLFFFSGVMGELDKTATLKHLRKNYKTEFSELYDGLQNIKNKANAHDFNLFTSSVVMNPTTIAVLFGVEFIKDYQNSRLMLPHDYICLNRANVIVSESDAKKFFDKAKTEQDPDESEK